MKRPRGARATAIAAVVTFLAGACTGSTEPSPPPSATPTAGVPDPQIQPGGSVVFGAEGWPQCLNPVHRCSEERGSDWAWYSVFTHVLPRAMQLDPGGKYVPSPLLVEAPTLENGGLRRGPPFTVTFRIRDQAVWEDGSPITSGDFDFTWKAILHTTNSISSERHELIRSVDTTDPRRVTIEFRDVTALWPEFFGGSRGFILKKDAFPKADPARPNLRLAMKRAVRFSGGPWILESWSSDQAVLVRNGRYFGRQPLLDHVVFVPRTDPSIEARSFFNGEIAAIYPRTSDVSWLDRCCPSPDKTITGDGTSFEALWFRTDIRPLNDRAVREALMYAIDRQAVVDNVAKLNNPNAEVLNCGFVALPNGPFCMSRPFERFTYDQAKARGILERAGFDCSTLLQPCTKDGRPLRIEYLADALSPLQVAIEDLVIEQAAKAGFEIKPIQIGGAGVLFGRSCPFNYQVTQCAIKAPPDGSATHVLGCAAVPTKRNGYEGENRMRWCNVEADRLMRESDRELDPTLRLQLLNRVHEIEADYLMGLPLFVMPAVSLWRTDKVAGPIGVWNGTPYGLFFNMNEWHLLA